MKPNFLLLLLCFSFISAFSSPWQNKVIRADSLVQRHDYLGASKRYEKLLKNQNIPADSTFHIKVQLAKCYEQMGATIKAEALYAQLEGSDWRVDENIRFAYARVLEANGKCESAKAMFLKTNNPAAKDFAEIAEESCADAFTDKQVEVKPLSLNSPATDFAPVMYKKGLVFTSNRKRKRHTMLVIAEENSKGGWSKVKPFSKKMKGHNSKTATFNTTGDEIFFSRNNCGKYRNHLCIVKSTNHRHWSRPKRLPFENPEYNYTQPSLSADGKTLYFSSDMPGGAGGMDIWMSIKTTDSTWSTPLNLGDTVNTPGDEVYPFITENGNLYFSSNGHAGMGGLDIFIAKTNGDKFISVTNLEMPINSAKDDFGIFISPADRFGYFSSNRGGDDDIYQFEQQKKPATDHPLIRAVASASAPNAYEIKGLGDATAIINFSNGKTATYISDRDGYFYFKPDTGVLYQIMMTKRDYDTVNFALISSAREEDNTTRQIMLKLQPRNTEEPVMSVNNVKKDTTGELIKPVWHIVEPGETLSSIGKKFGSSVEDMRLWNNFKSDNLAGVKSMIVGYQYDSEFKDLLAMKALEKSGVNKNDRAGLLEQIRKYYASKMEKDKSTLYGMLYFDFNSKDLTLSITELNILSSFLKDKKEVSVEVVGHTDNIGTAESNLQLSKARAKSVYDYLISKGIPADRIRYSFKGSSMPVDSNETEEGRAQNRRVEIYLTQ